MKLLRDMLAGMQGVETSGTADVRIQGIAYDSRKVRAGFLFVALTGEHTDGNLFVDQALERGAAAVASERPIQPASGTAALRVPDGRRFLAHISRIFFDDPAARLKLVAITGTNGKTTTSCLVDSVFRSNGLNSCVVGTIGIRLGERALPSTHTTPEAPDLYSLFGEAAAAGCTHGALEVSSHALALRRVLGMKFRVGVFTNLTPEHLDFHPDMESYYQAKRLLFTHAGENEIDLAVINCDDLYGRRLAREISRPFSTFGYAPEADVRPLQSVTRADATSLRLATPAGEFDLATRLVGRPNVYNIMAATAASLDVGMSLAEIARGIEQVPGVPGRMQPVDAGQPFAVFVDYAHTPDALENLLQTAAALPHNRIITVFGCGGDRDRKKRPEMGRIAASGSDLVIATSDNPRTENPEAILAEIEPGLRRGNAKWEVISDRRAAIRRAVQTAGAGDIVLIAGKGHESYQVVGHTTLPFDDCAVARESILQLGQRPT